MPEKNYLVRMNNFLEQVLVVLVIYETNIAESVAYRSLTQALTVARSSTTLFIYDNSSLLQQPPRHGLWSVHYFHDPSNPGVSKAYNEGFRLAMKKNMKWLLLVDQDTFFPPNSFDEYFRVALKHSIVVPTLRDKLGIVSPLKFYFGGGQREKSFENKPVLKLSDFLFHNSGLLISTEAFEKAGGYDENLPLDFSDFAFVYRLRHHHQEFAIADFSCAHRLATSEVTSLDKRLVRFESYFFSAKYFKKTYVPSEQLLMLRVFLRGLKFCLQYGTLKFMKPFFRRA